MPLGLAGSGITRIYLASWRDVRTTWQHDVAYRRTWQAFRQFRLLFVHVMLQELGYLGEHPAWRFECASDEFVAVASEAIGVARCLICGLVARTQDACFGPACLSAAYDDRA
ncbi:MAG: hypothetical protein C4346_13280 [Chloroflexota bacterium]